jgi:hypothetical protein
VWVAQLVSTTAAIVSSAVFKLSNLGAVARNEKLEARAMALSLGLLAFIGWLFIT